MSITKIEKSFFGYAQYGRNLFNLKLFLLIFLWAQLLNAQVSDFSNIDFKKADSIALSLNKEDLTNLPELSYKLTTNLTTDAERFRAIYFWVCSNIKNDYNSYLNNKHKRQRFKDDSLKFEQWNTKFRKKLFNKLLKKKRTICTGYAYLVKTLSDLADIECEIVQGYGRVSTTDIENLTLPNHSWNAVKLNDKWYLCDPTWASGIPNPETNLFTFQYNDGFFFTNPELFGINHYPIEKKWWLLKDDIPEFKDFLESPIIYGKAYKNLESHNTPKKMHQIIKINDIVNFEYQLKKAMNLDEVKLLIDDGQNSIKIKPRSISIKDKLLILKHQFNKKGFYDLHLYLFDDLISTYTFKVI